MIGDRYLVLWLFPNSRQVTKSPFCVCSNFLENRRWPTWVETHFSDVQKTESEKCRCTTRSPIPFSDNLENCRLTISKTILFSKFLVTPGGRKWSGLWSVAKPARLPCTSRESLSVQKWEPKKSDRRKAGRKGSGKNYMFCVVTGSTFTAANRHLRLRSTVSCFMSV